ncbi:PPC domain-containing DNA-binding protein [Vibrio maritimus]|jgi:predicted DNA-binding protein with PD1-like motif|uniref:PPC domain-containing DNA-binding protein n=1 Tax=Vibrio chaetopteri TaxID=3016528 RepID=A0AAU8BPN8_9VIBR
MSVLPFAVRLQRGTDLKLAIRDVVDQLELNAGTIASCVGCLTKATLRLAGAEETITLEGSFEIVSVMGTLTASHQHVHLSVATRTGEVLGGHLLEGCIVDTTVELIIHNYTDNVFTREYDPTTGFSELVIPQNR